MLTLFKRIFKIGYQNFKRNIGLSIGTTFVLVMVVSFINLLVVFNLVSDILIDQVKRKVDISVYFKENASTEDILAIKSILSKMPEVKEVEYVSQDQTLNEFVERHKNEPALIESLEEIGINPFSASLNIKAAQASQYEQIANFLETETYKNFIDKIDYYERKPVVERLYSITNSINRGGIIISIVLAVFAALIAFNTIRIAIYSLKEEVETMRLVGASNWFIRGSFLVQGAIVGFVSVLISLILVFAFCWIINTPFNKIAPDIRILSIFFSHFWMLFFIQLLTGLSIGIFSSLLAIRKYIKI